MGGKGFRQHSKVVWPGFSDVARRHVAKVGRNEPCPCGSGKKFKDCHAKQGSAYLEKLAREQDKLRRRELRLGAKERKSSWFRWLLGRE